MPDTITVRLSRKLQEELSRIARKEGTSRSEIVREALTHYLAIKRFRQLRKKVLPFAEAEGLLTDEDIFKLIS